MGDERWQDTGRNDRCSTSPQMATNLPLTVYNHCVIKHTLDTGRNDRDFAVHELSAEHSQCLTFYCTLLLSGMFNYMYLQDPPITPHIQIVAG